MDKKVMRERMRQKQRQMRMRRRMKLITCVAAAILLVVFVVRGVILPIANHVTGGGSKDGETVNVQANAGDTAGSQNTQDTASAGGTADSTDNKTDTSATVMPVKGKSAADKLSVMTPGWHQDDNGKWYQNPDGTYYISGLADIDGTTYSFDSNGYMQTGWVTIGAKDYFFNDDGSYDPTQKRKMIALTFDDGPGEYTEELLDCVEQNGVKVTFFMLGQNVEGYESTVQRMVSLGCEIGNHTWDHPEQTLPNMDMDSVVQEFQKTDDALIQACGQASTVCRAPYGAITEEQINAVGKPFFMWSTDSLDWKLMDASADYDSIMGDSTLGDGSIILMHDIHEPSVKCAEKLIPDLVAQGYKLVTVSELAAAKDVTLQNASYTDFWDSSLEAGRVPGYNGSSDSSASDGSSDASDSSSDGSGDVSDGSSDSSDVSDGSSDGSDVSDGSSDSSDVSDGSSDSSDTSDSSSDYSSDDGSYDDSSDYSSDDGSYDDSSDYSSDDGSYDDSSEY